MIIKHNTRNTHSGCRSYTAIPWLLITITRNFYEQLRENVINNINQLGRRGYMFDVHAGQIPRLRLMLDIQDRILMHRYW